MEQNIKNFDRGVEQKMNEHEVAPPFGMWNRISAELDAMPLAAATAAPVATALIPKRAMVGIIAAALIMGTTILTGYLVNSSLNTDKANTNIAVSPKTVNATNIPQQTAPVKSDEASPMHIAMVKPAVKHHPASNPLQSTMQLAQQVQPTVNQPVTTNPALSNGNNSLINSNANTDVPTPIEPIAQNAETTTYYFPPIDVNTPEKAKTETEPTFTIRKASVINATASNNKEESFGPPSERKFHPRLHGKKKFTYGSIIR